MRVMLDTHAMFWYVEGDSQLSVTARSLIQNLSNEILVSPASYWEIAIKVSLGKWTLNRPYEDFMGLVLDQYGFQILPIQPSHTAHLAGLAFPPDHKDPFDRLIVSQAIVEGISVVSADAKLDAYPVHRLW